MATLFCGFPFQSTRRHSCVNINIRLFSIVDAKMADPAVALLTKAYGAVEQCAKRGLHPEEFLMFEFLKEHPILLQPGTLRVDWNHIPGLTRRIGTLSTVVIPDHLWGRWLGDWRDSWEPDEQPGHFIRNVALVVCRSRFNDNPDTKGRDKRVNSLAIAHVPDSIRLSTFAEADALLKKTEVNLNSVICLTWLHKAAKYYPDYFCHRKGRQLTLQHMQDRLSAAGAAANFAGGELLTTYTASKREETYSKLPPGYREGCAGDLINTGGRSYKVWESGRDKKKRPDIHDIPLASVTMMLRMPEHGDFPKVIIDMEPFSNWPKNRRPKEVAWIIPARGDPPTQTGSAGSPAHDESDSSDQDSGCSSPEGSRPATPALSVGSVAGSVAQELVVSSSSRSSSSSSKTGSVSGRPSDGEDEQVSNDEQAGHSGGEEGRSGDEGGPGPQAGNPDGTDGQETEDSSSDSGDESSDGDGGNPEGAQHLEEVYSRVLTALHKTAKILCSGYVKASGEIQPIVNAAVREAVLPNKVYIRSTSGHLDEWGHVLYNMLNSGGASVEEREEASRAARLAGLKCVRSLLAEGQVFNAAEERDIEKKLHDTVQSALKVANDRANKTLRKVNKRVPKIIRKYVPMGQAGTFLASVHRSMSEHYLSVHGMVMSQVVIPFHVARGTYFTSSNMFRAINNVVPGISAAATGFQAAPSALPAPPATTAETASLSAQPPKESLETPTKDTSTGHSSKRGTGEAGTSGHGGDRGSGQKSSGGAPLMKQARKDFKTKEQKIQTGGTPGSKRSSSGKKLDSAAINKTWDGFEREDAHSAARRVLEMNPQSGGTILSTSDHELSVEFLSARDAPPKRKADSSTDDDEEHPVAESSRRKKKKKTQPDSLDMFDSDYKGQSSFSRSKPLPTTKPDASGKPGKGSKHRDDDSGLGSSLGASHKSKKAKKQKGSGKPDLLDDELRKRKERQEKATRDQRACQALLVENRPLQYALELETMKDYRAKGLVTARQAACENFDDHSAYVQYVLDNNKQSFVCQSFHLFTVDAFFRRVRYKISQAEGEEKSRLQEVFSSSQTTLAKKLPGCKGRASDSYLAKYVIRVLKASDGTVLDASHLEFGGEHNLGLHGLVSPVSTARITRNKKKHFHDGWGDGHIEHGFCPLCTYVSGTHKAISNHIRGHLRLAMYCGWCYYVSLSTEDMLQDGREH